MTSSLAVNLILFKGELNIPVSTWVQDNLEIRIPSASGQHTDQNSGTGRPVKHGRVVLAPCKA